jgi:hypothetical protein
MAKRSSSTFKFQSAVIKKLSLLTSRCTMGGLRLCKYIMPAAACRGRVTHLELKLETAMQCKR